MQSTDNSKLVFYWHEQIKRLLLEARIMTIKYQMDEMVNIRNWVQVALQWQSLSTNIDIESL
jgi:hypothetical protein